jgi:hypothetical protein
MVFIMNKERQQNTMSGLDWFALASGIIGLVADIITLVSLNQLGSLTKLAQTTIWMIAPIGILYTTIILNFYALRIAVVRYLKAYGTLSEQMLIKIREGGRICAQVVGTPLLLLYGVSLIIFLLQGVSSFDTFIVGFFIVGFLIFGTAATIILMNFIGMITEIIYAAFDPNYTVKEYRRKTKALERTIKQE